MRRVVLLGNPDTKRTVYFQRAAREAGLHVFFLDWRRWERDGLGTALQGMGGWKDGIWMKIDPPVWDSCFLDELNGLTDAYKRRLGLLSELAGDGNIRFLNHPGDIAALLDKRGCKERLHGAGLPVTEVLDAAVENAGQLLEVMRRRRVPQVFIKPVTGSGAAGTAAFRCQLGGGQMALYTCALVEQANGRLVNTKKLWRITSREQVFLLLDRILGLGCVVERWYAKAAHQGCYYDLRAVMQDGRLDFLLARLSRGPITNLHLNNHPLRVKELGLPDDVIREVIQLCRQAMECYPGLQSAGIDILLEKGSLKPRIIEMNGQGDLVYQDIFDGNIIYRRQAELAKRQVFFGN